MINYYEILEVSEKASDEIIEKAYKVLAKKYHPDLQQGDNKKVAEEKMKLINEAYEILSKKEKREAYNRKLNEQREKEIIKKQVQSSINNNYTKANTNNYRTSSNTKNTNQNNYNQKSYAKEEMRRQQKYKKKVQTEARRKYLEAYDNYLRSLGYKVKYRWTWQKVKKLLISIIVLIIVGACLWFIPPTKRYIIQMYEENFIIKMIVDIVISIVESFLSFF